MIRRPVTRTLALRAVLVAAVFAAACGGGGGGTTDPGPPPSSLTFTAAGSAPAGDGIVLSRTNAGPDSLVLDVRAVGVENLYGAFFDLTYPSDVLAFDGSVEGTFLAQGGAQSTLQIAQQDGRLVVGASRLGGVGGVSGSGTLVTLIFSARAAGSGSLAFSDNDGRDAGGKDLALDWLGGSVQITR